MEKGDGKLVDLIIVMFVIGYLFFLLLALALSVIGDIFNFFVFHYPNVWLLQIF